MWSREAWTPQIPVPPKPQDVHVCLLYVYFMSTLCLLYVCQLFHVYFMSTLCLLYVYFMSTLCLLCLPANFVVSTLCLVCV